MPKVSVIIPVYNVEKYLKQCLDSIIHQTLKDIEIICINDGSTDKSLEVLRKYEKQDKRIKVLSQKNSNAGAVRNKGIGLAKGEYLSFLDGDDFFDLHMLEEMYNKAINYQSDIVICGWYNYNNVTKKKNVHLPNIDKTSFNPINVKNSLFDITYPNPWTKLFKRELFIDNNLLFENLKRCNDFTCVYRSLTLANKISIIKKPLVYYRSNQINNLTANRSKSFDCFIQAVNKLYEGLKESNKYEIYKETFIKRSLNSMKKELSSCKDKNAFYKLMKDTINKDLYNNIGAELDKLFGVSKKPVTPRVIHHKKNKYF